MNTETMLGSGVVMGNDINNLQDNENSLAIEIECAASKQNESDYYRRIDECAEKKANVFIENGLPAHALYLLQKMFSKAKDSIRLFSGNLCLERDGVKIYSDPCLIKAAQDFLRRGGSLKIVIEKNIASNLAEHPLIAGIKEVGSPNVELRQLNPGYENCNHFIVMDDIAYRIEHDDEKTKAIANFGDSKIARAQAKIFDLKLLPGSKQIFPVAI